MVEVKYKPVDNYTIPFSYSRENDACLDVFSHEDAVIPAKGIRVVSTGMIIQLPVSYEATIRNRSGLTANGIIALPGTIDEEYRGVIRVTMLNVTDDSYIVKRGDRIAQIAVRPIPKVEMVEVEELSETNRGDQGYGSSGK